MNQDERPMTAALVDAAVMRECEQGLWETVKIFRQLNVPDGQIAFMFRAMADQLQPPTIIHPEPPMTQ